jgi:tetratricopeptide (TPR) repeat protein
MAGFEQNDPQDRLTHEAEELMRQRRFGDAAERYHDLIAGEPTDLWVRLGWISALECAGRLDDARTQLEETARNHRRSAPFQRFRRLFFERREDAAAAAVSQKALRTEVIDDGPDDQLADLYFNQGRYLEARAELERLLTQGIEDDGMRAAATARLGACLRQTGDLDNARIRLLEALDSEPGSHWTLTELAEVERARGDVDAARTRYQEALAAEPDDHWARGHLAQLEFEDGNPDDAVKLYEEIIDRVPSAAWPLVELAQVLTEKDPARSAALCLRALELDPRNPWAHAQLGTLARRAGRPEEAREKYLRALEGSPGAVWILHELADTCRQLGRTSDGHEYLLRALEEDPYHAVTHGYLADFMRHEGRNDEALAHLAKAVEIDPDYGWAWRELAEVHSLAGRHEAADIAYAKVRELDGEAALADGLKAFLLRCRNQREAALPWLERAVDKQPDYLWAWRERIETLLGLGRTAEATAISTQAVGHLPNAGVIHALHSEALRRGGRRDEALTAAVRACGLAPDAPQPWAIRAELLLAAGDHSQAEAAAREALVRAEGASDYRVLLAQVLIATGRDTEASTIIEPILSTDSVVPAAYELAAHLAERKGDRDAAIAWCDRGLIAQPRDARLAVRRARLAGTPLPSHLDPLFASEDPAVPWREIAGLYAQAERQVEARRAAYRWVEESAGDPVQEGRAWLSLAETELSLGNPSAATAALDHGLSKDASQWQGRLLGALLAEGRGDRVTALGHLHHLDEHLGSHHPGRPNLPAGEPVLARQLALMYERTGETSRARRVWDRLHLAHPADLEAATDRATFFARHGTTEEAAAATQKAETLLGSSPARYRFWRDLALATAARHGAASAVAGLLAREADLDDDLRLLTARLALSAGEPDKTLRLLAGLGQTPTPVPGVAPLRVRALLASGSGDAALAAAQALHRDHPNDEEAATLHAECLASRARFAEAFAQVTARSLPERPTTERGLLNAVLALELHGPPWCLATLARLGEPDHDVPLVRVFAAAWPGAWAIPDPARPATVTDVLSLPPFPRLCRWMGTALTDAGRHDLAAEFLAAALAFHERSRNGWWSSWWHDRDLRRRTCAALVRAGRIHQALHTAWRGASLSGLRVAIAGAFIRS